MNKRVDDFETRKVHLANLSDEELKQRFWDLAEQIMNPMIELGKKNTTPSIERSVLLRMGFSSLEAKPILDNILENGLISKGAGNVVYKLAKHKNISVREAGLLIKDKKCLDEIEMLFRLEDQKC